MTEIITFITIKIKMDTNKLANEKIYAKKRSRLYIKLLKNKLSKIIMIPDNKIPKTSPLPPKKSTPLLASK